MSIEATRYRPDIDCLRAFSVLSVVAFHLGLPPFRAGFIGVDVFFVISGYLITRIICSELSAGQFSIVAFYERRVRRILPALFVVVLCVLGAALWILLPVDYLDLAKSALALLAFVSNYYFWLQSGYFDHEALTRPLLHTWSLSVEEQFYLVFPLLLMGVMRLSTRRVLPIVFCLIAIASLAFNEHQLATNRASAFYLAPGRAWEFLLGSLLAIDFVKAGGFKLRLAGAVLGWAMLGVSVNAFVPTTPLPGLNALLPCGGAALVIWAQIETGPAGLRFLAPMLFAGKISYSLYLWHWPVIVFAREMFGPIGSFGERIVLLSIAFGLSVLSYFWIEGPFRNKQWIGRKALFSATAVVALGIAAIAMAAVATGGFRFRATEQVNAILDVASFDYKTAYNERTCFLDKDQPASNFDEAKCFTPKPNMQDVVLWGDSHAAHLINGLRSRFPAVNFMQATAAACPPIIDVSIFRMPNCRPFNSRIRELLLDHRPDTVIISANWISDAYRDAIEGQLRETIVSLLANGIDVVVIGPMIQYDESLPVMMAKRLVRNGDASNFNERLVPGLSAMDDKIRSVVASAGGAAFFSILQSVCRDRQCPVLTPRGLPLSWDGSHLTDDGSDDLVGRLLPNSVFKKRATN